MDVQEQGAELFLSTPALHPQLVVLFLYAMEAVQLYLQLPVFQAILGQQEQQHKV